MTKIEMLKFQVSNLDKVLEHSSKLIDEHRSLVTMTQRIVDTFSSLTKKEKKSLTF